MCVGEFKVCSLQNGYVKLNFKGLSDLQLWPVCTVTFLQSCPWREADSYKA